MGIRTISLRLSFLILLTTTRAYTSTLFMGSIQFPELVKTVPDIRIYYAGHKVTATTNNNTKDISFNICESQSCATFYLIITNDIELETPKKSNTIKYLANKHKAYKFYVIKRIKRDTGNGPQYEWIIQDIPLIGNRIPDNTLIVYYNPTYIENIVLDTAIRLLKINIKNKIFELAGSEKKLQEESEMLLCSAINLDSIHTKIEPKTKQFYEKLVIASL